MNIEDTKFVVEVSDYKEVNEHLKLGWVLINKYNYDVGEYGQPSQKVFYVLAWQKPDFEPEHPEKSSYLRQKRSIEHLTSIKPQRIDDLK